MTPPAWSYRPGSWFAIFGTAATVLLPASEKHRVAELWSLVDDGAGPAPVLDALISSGLSELPGFVLIGCGAEGTTVVVRGAARLEAIDDGAAVVVTADGARTWVEHTFRAVSALTIHLEDDDHDSADLSLDTGLVRVARVDSPARPLPSGPFEDGPFEDGDTAAGIDASEFARARPGIIDQDPAPDVTTSVARLVISNGVDVEVDRVVLIGRAPEPRRFTSSDEPRLVSVPSPLHEISATHVEIRPGTGVDHGSAVVTDMGSTNGTVVVQPGLGPEGLRPGIPVQLLPGATINLGDGITISVTRP